MGDTDVNVYPACNAAHFMGGVAGGINIHIGVTH